MDRMKLYPHSDTSTNNDNLHYYRDVFIIAPAYSTKNGTGYATFEHGTQLLLPPSPKPIHKNETKAMVLGVLDSCSQKRLNLDLEGISSGLHHNVFDAVGLGLQIIKSIILKPKHQKNGRNRYLVRHNSAGNF